MEKISLYLSGTNLFHIQLKNVQWGTGHLEIWREVTVKQYTKQLQQSWVILRSMKMTRIPFV